MIVRRSARSSVPPVRVPSSMPRSVRWFSWRPTARSLSLSPTRLVSRAAICPNKSVRVSLFPSGFYMFTQNSLRGISLFSFFLSFFFCFDRFLGKPRTSLAIVQHDYAFSETHFRYRKLNYRITNVVGSTRNLRNLGESFRFSRNCIRRHGELGSPDARFFLRIGRTDRGL